MSERDWKGWIPLFVPFRSARLKSVFSDGSVDMDGLQRLADNSNYLIRRKLHVPDLRETHDGSVFTDRSLGWIEELEVDREKGRLMGRLAATPSGRKAIADKELRWVSIEMKKDAKLTGEDGGPSLPGPYLDHVALLGKTPPKVKGLTDLSECQFSDPPVNMAAVDDEDGGSLVVFRELESGLLEGSEDNDEGETEDDVTKPNEDAAAEVVSLKARIEELETANKALTDQNTERERAAMSEQVSSFQTRIDALAAAGKIGSDKVKALSEQAKQAAEGSEFTRALFAEHLSSFELTAKRKVPANKPAQFADVDETDADEETDDPEAFGVTRAMFSEVAKNGEASKKFTNAIRLRMSQRNETYGVARQNIIRAVEAHEPAAAE